MDWIRKFSRPINDVHGSKTSELRKIHSRDPKNSLYSLIALESLADEKTQDAGKKSASLQRIDGAKSQGAHEEDASLDSTADTKSRGVQRELRSPGRFADSKEIVPFVDGIEGKKFQGAHQEISASLDRTEATKSPSVQRELRSPGRFAFQTKGRDWTKSQARDLSVSSAGACSNEGSFLASDHPENWKKEDFQGAQKALYSPKQHTSPARKGHRNGTQGPLEPSALSQIGAENSIEGGSAFVAPVNSDDEDILYESECKIISEDMAALRASHYLNSPASSSSILRDSMHPQRIKRQAKVDCRKSPLHQKGRQHNGELNKSPLSSNYTSWIQRKEVATRGDSRKNQLYKQGVLTDNEAASPLSFCLPDELSSYIIDGSSNNINYQSLPGKNFQKLMVDMMLGEEDQLRDLRDLEEFVKSYQDLSSPHYRQVVNQFFHELCSELLQPVSLEDDSVLKIALIRARQMCIEVDT